jgi:NTP pyrophosphatase (non-canonical NTP hydrolase)
MEFNDYQEKAGTTAIYPNRGSNIYYPCLGLAGESGEVCEKIKKVMRDSDGKVSPETKELLKKELGDVLWYVSALSDELGLRLDDIAQHNIDKLFSRKDRGKLKGSGDER